MYSLKNKEELKLYSCLINKKYILIIIRGGAWRYVPQDVYSTYRNQSVPAYWNYNLGFRCVKKVKQICTL